MPLRTHDVGATERVKAWFRQRHSLFICGAYVVGTGSRLTRRERSWLTRDDPRSYN